MTDKKEAAAFDKAASEYIKMFGGSLPLGVGYDDLTTRSYNEYDAGGCKK